MDLPVPVGHRCTRGTIPGPEPDADLLERRRDRGLSIGRYGVECAKHEGAATAPGISLDMGAPVYGLQTADGGCVALDRLGRTLGRDVSASVAFQSVGTGPSATGARIRHS